MHDGCWCVQCIKPNVPELFLHSLTSQSSESESGFAFQKRCVMGFEALYLLLPSAVLFQDFNPPQLSTFCPSSNFFNTSQLQKAQCDRTCFVNCSFLMGFWYFVFIEGVVLPLLRVRRYSRGGAETVCSA